MAWRFSLPLGAIAAAGRETQGHLFDDSSQGRYRWAFGPFLQEAQRANGGTLPLPLAVVRIAPELDRALAHIDHRGPDENMFGIVYDSGTGSLAGADAVAAADQQRRNAVMFLRTGLSSPEDAADFIEPSISILQSALKDRDPNNLAAAATLAACLFHTRRELPALAEWCDTYCRLRAYLATLERAPRFDGLVAVRAVQAYEPSFKAGLVADLVAHAQLLQASALIRDPMPPADLHQKFRDIQSAIEWVNAQVANLNSAVAGNAWQFTGGYVTAVPKAVQTLLRVWKKANLRVYPRWMKEAMLACARALDNALRHDRDPKRRLLAAQALGEIPLLETIDVLKAHQSDADLAIVAAVERSIVAVGHRVSGLG